MHEEEQQQSSLVPNSDDLASAICRLYHALQTRTCLFNPFNTMSNYACSSYKSSSCRVLRLCGRKLREEQGDMSPEFELGGL